jgi:hypothetical protein
MIASEERCRSISSTPVGLAIRNKLAVRKSVRLRRTRVSAPYKTRQTPRSSRCLSSQGIRKGLSSTVRFWTASERFFERKMRVAGGICKYKIKFVGTGPDSYKAVVRDKSG